MAALAIIGPLVTISGIWWRDHKAQLDDDAKVNAEINLIIQTATDFDPIVRRYITLARAGDPQANGYLDRIRSDPRVSRMNDVIAKPVTQWPSIQSSDAFRTYYKDAFDLLELSVDKRPIMTLDEGVKGYDGKLAALQRALNAARR